jgi:hypothetical protein
MRRALPPGMVPGQMVPGQMPGAGGDDSPQRGSGPYL